MEKGFLPKMFSILLHTVAKMKSIQVFQYMENNAYSRKHNVDLKTTGEIMQQHLIILSLNKRIQIHQYSFPQTALPYDWLMPPLGIYLYI